MASPTSPPHAFLLLEALKRGEGPRFSQGQMGDAVTAMLEGDVHELREVMALLAPDPDAERRFAMSLRSNLVNSLLADDLRQVALCAQGLAVFGYFQTANGQQIIERWTQEFSRTHMAAFDELGTFLPEDLQQTLVAHLGEGVPRTVAALRARLEAELPVASPARSGLRL
jgi:hypothetical protein